MAPQALDSVGAAMRDLVGVVHGTTLAITALIARTGAKVATVNSDGFRDILEIAYERSFDQ